MSYAYRNNRSPYLLHKYTITTLREDALPPQGYYWKRAIVYRDAATGRDGTPVAEATYTARRRDANQWRPRHVSRRAARRRVDMEAAGGGVVAGANEGRRFR